MFILCVFVCVCMYDIVLPHIRAFALKQTQEEIIFDSQARSLENIP